VSAAGLMRAAFRGAAFAQMAELLAVAERSAPRAFGLPLSERSLAAFAARPRPERGYR